MSITPATAETGATPAAERPTKERLSDGLRHVVDEADSWLKSAVSVGDRRFDEARLKLEHQLDAIRRELDELEESALHRARRAAREADLAVQQHPYRAIGVAAAAGMLLGVLLSRR